MHGDACRCHNIDERCKKKKTKKKSSSAQRGPGEARSVLPRSQPCRFVTRLLKLHRGNASTNGGHVWLDAIVSQTWGFDYWVQRRGEAGGFNAFFGIAHFRAQCRLQWWFEYLTAAFALRTCLHILHLWKWVSCLHSNRVDGWMDVQDLFSTASQSNCSHPPFSKSLWPVWCKHVPGAPITKCNEIT